MGISTYIAVLLLMVLAIAAGVMIYAYTMGYLGNASINSGNEALTIASSYQHYDPITGIELDVYVKNVGKDPVTIDSPSGGQTTIYINNKDFHGFFVDPNQRIVHEGETSEISVFGLDAYTGTTVRIKIVTISGAFTEANIKIMDVPTQSGQYSVTFVLGSGGQSMSPTAGAHTYGGGASVPISATADGTHVFSQWTSDTPSITFDDANAASTNAHIGAAGTITATFSTAQYSVTFVLGSGGQSMSPTAGAHTYNAGSTVAISTTANNGYHFTSWTSSTGSITFDSATSASTNAHINGAGTVTANFASNSNSMIVTLTMSGESQYYYTETHALAHVTVVDGNGNAVQGATITANWSGTYGTYTNPVTGTTDATGKFTFDSGWGGWKWPWDTNSYTFRITNVVKSPLTYNQGTISQTINVGPW
jgi:hypothetical protein